MAVVFSNNATTVLSSNITNSATSIAVQDGSVFPTLSGTDYFYATLQDPGNTKREIVKVTARSGNTLTVTRAVDGSSASAFSANDAFELRLNAAALNDAVNSGTADLELNSFTGDGSEVDFTLSMEALEANTLVYIDGVYQNKTAYSISGYVLTFSAAPDNGAAIEVTTATVAPIQESTDFLLNQFTGDGSDTTFTLSSSPEENQTTVFISGVYQSKSNYSISGTTLTFSTAPPASSSIEVMVARTVVYGIGTPSNDTVSTAKIVDGAVTPAKLSLTYATETFVGTAVSNLVDSSPAALDTLNELAAALGDDPNFATTVTDSIALKAPLASPSFTGNLTMASGGSIVAGGVNDLILNAGESGTPDIYLQSGGSTKVKIEGSNGSVGIGGSTITDANLLNIQGSSASVNVGVVFNDTNTSKIFGIQNGGSALKFFDYTASVERLRIDSAGTVKISHADTASEGLRVIQTTAGRTSGGALGLFYDDQAGTTQPTLKVIQNGTGDILQLFDGGSQVVTVKDGGNLLVGTTNPYPHLFTSGKGFAINQGTFGIDAACDNIVGIFNRTGTDGSILEFKKDGATVGSIGTVSGDIRIGGLDDNHASIRFAASSKAVLPVKNSDGDLSDNTTDLGASNARFKYLYLSGGINNGTNTIAFSGGAFAGDGAGNDANIDLGRNNRRFQNLYLSGGVVFGSTGGSVTSKTLDDYEEGTWTPTYSIDNGSVTSYNVQQGWYVKVGSFVTLWFQIQANFSSGAYYIRLANLPYAVSAPNTQPLRLPVYVEGSEGYLAVAGGSVFYTGSTINAYATGNDYTGRRVSGSYTYRTS